MSFGFGFGLPSWQTLSGGFTPASLFTGGEQGCWYDPSDYGPNGTLFQDSAGTTPVTAVEQFVGLMLDKSKGALPSTKGGVTPGTANNYFSSPDSAASSITGDIDIQVQVALVDWTPSAIQLLVAKDTASVGGRSYAVFVNTSGTVGFQKTTNGTTLHIVNSSVATGFADGSTNWVRVTYASATGNVDFYYSSNGVNWTQLGTTQTTTSGAIADTAAQLAIGVFSDAISLPANGKFYRVQIYNGINGTLAVDFNPTLYTTGNTFTAATGEVWTRNGTAYIVPDGNHATSTGTKRPKLAARYNLLTYTEQFDNAAWGKTSVTVAANAAVAPNGTTTADRLVTNNGSNALWYLQQIPSIASQSLKFNIFAKADAALHIGFSIDSGVRAGVNLSTGTITLNDFGITVVGLSDGWYNISWSSTGDRVRVFCSTTAITVANQSVTGDGTSGIYIWGADLRPASQATGLIGPTYQRVVDAATYDAVGFLPYLVADGTDDAMNTGNIVPGTDKAQVFVGLRKLSDATQVIAELSVDAGSNNGSILSYVEAANVQYGLYSKGTNAAIASINSGFAAPNTVVFTGIGNISGDVATLRLNGAQVATSSANQGTGDYLTYPLYLFGRGGTSTYFNGWMYGLIIRFGPNLSTSQIESTEAYLNQKSGSY